MSGISALGSTLGWGYKSGNTEGGVSGATASIPSDGGTRATAPVPPTTPSPPSTPTDTSPVAQAAATDRTTPTPAETSTPAATARPAARGKGEIVAQAAYTLAAKAATRSDGPSLLSHA